MVGRHFQIRVENLKEGLSHDVDGGGLMDATGEETLTGSQLESPPINWTVACRAQTT